MLAATIAAALFAPIKVLGMVFVPENDEEASVLVGLALIVPGFIVAWAISWTLACALLVPGALFIAIGLGFNLRRGG